MESLIQYYLREFRPLFLGRLTKLIFSSKKVVIGKNFRCDSIPKILIDGESRIVIENDVEFRRNIEIRAHKSAKIHIGRGSRIDRGARILAANKANINLDNGVRIGLYTVLNGGDSIHVGEKTLISGFVYLQTSMHSFTNKATSIQDQGYDHAPIRLEKDVWIGTHVVVMPGVTLGRGAVVGSNAVVTKSVEEYKVVAGIPAKELKGR